MRRYLRIFLAVYFACVVFSLAHVLPGNLITHGRSIAADDEKTLKPTNIERLNTSADEEDAILAPSVMAFYFTTNGGGNRRLMMATRKERAALFINPKPIEELNGNSDTLSPFPMPRDMDGSEYIFFATQGDAKNLDIYFTRRLKPTEPYQRIAMAPVHQVCTPEDEAYPWVSADSKEMYFSRKTKDGWKVGRAYGKDPRSFEKVELLDFPPDFSHTAVTKDGLTMYLQGPVENKKLALFISKRGSKTAAWGKPEPLTVLNAKDSVKGDCSPSLSADGFRLYFASDRPGGKGGLDLYYVSTNDLKKAGL